MITFSRLGNMGNLGNQLFQIAVTITTAIQNDESFVFPRWKHQPYFNLHDCFVDNVQVNKIYQEPHFHYTPIPEVSDIDLLGYFQSEKYFADCRGKILNVLEFTDPIPNSDLTSIHVRRGDYLTIGNDYHTNLTMEYYERAMQLIGSEKYLVFSDDIDWCRANFRGEQFIFSENKSPIEDMKLMAACTNNIIANSSFSWWGAYLNKNPDKVVIAPQKWFGNKLPHDTKDLIPKNWKVLL